MNPDPLFVEEPPADFGQQLPTDEGQRELDRLYPFPWAAIATVAVLVALTALAVTLRITR